MADPSLVTDVTQPTQAGNKARFAADEIRQIKAYLAGLVIGKINQAPVPNTVLSGPSDINGLPTPGGVIGATTITNTAISAAYPWVVDSPNGLQATGTADSIGISTANLVYTGLSVNGTMYLLNIVSAAGTITTGVTVNAVAVQEGGAVTIVTAGFYTYVKSDRQMYLGNGVSVDKVNVVFVGECTVAAGVVSAIIWYAYQGKYISPWIATLPGVATATSFNHNLGIYPDPNGYGLELECTTIDLGFLVGDRLPGASVGTNNAAVAASPIPKYAVRLTCGFTTGNTTAFNGTNKTTGVGAAHTAASWKYRMFANRGF